MFRIATPSRWAIVLLMVISVFISVRYRLLGDDGQAWKYAINNDGKGYYEHLRTLLLDGDIHGEPWMFTPAGDSEAIKFFVGTAVVQAPFVLVAHLHTLLFADGLEDGYSLHYQLAIVLSALVSLLLGLWFTRELLLGIGIGEIATAFTLMAITLGTGLMVQTVVHPGMSHVHSFAGVAGLLLAVRHACTQGKPWRWALAGGLLGLVIVLRPVDVLIIAGLPLATLGVVPSMPRVRPKELACFSLAFGALLFVQTTTWFVQCGEWIIRPYANEGFNWDRPAIVQHLFSARNGLLFYWPVLLLVLPGMWIIGQRMLKRVAPFALFLVVFAYVTSAWWNWSYGDSFGQRPYVDVLALLAVPMAFAIDAPRARRRIAWMASAVPLIALNLFQSWQYNANILAPGHLDLSKYGYVFLRTDPARAAALGGKEDHAPYAPNGMFAALDTRCSWTPDSSGTMRWVMPAMHASEGLWYVHLGITRTELEPGTAQKMEATVSGNGPGWPAGGIHFKVEHLPRSTSPTIRWNNALCVPPRIVGDTIALHLAVPSGCKVDTLFLRVMAPN